MRTTVNLPDDLMTKLKKRAAERRTTITALIEDALRAALSGRQPRSAKQRVRLTTFGRKGVHPGVDLDDSQRLLDVMEERRGTARR